MTQAFTRNYYDNSTDAGFQFTFYCDVCNDGFKSSFIESQTYKKKKGTRLFGQGIGLVGSLLGGKVGNWAIPPNAGAISCRSGSRGSLPNGTKSMKKRLNAPRTKSSSVFTAAPTATDTPATNATTRTRGFAQTAPPDRKCM